MLLTPSGVSSFRALVELLVLVAEDEPDVDVRILRFDKQMLLPIAGDESPFGFDVKKPTVLGGYLEIGCVFRTSRRPFVRNLFFFVNDFSTCLFKLLCYVDFKTASIAS
jgi:hypothetical protein